MRFFLKFSLNLATVLVVLAGPVFVIGIGWGFRLIYDESKLAFYVFCFATMIFSYGVALLADNQRTPGSPSEHD